MQKTKIKPRTINGINNIISKLEGKRCNQEKAMNYKKEYIVMKKERTNGIKINMPNSKTG
ncbi:hypothetical protein GCM10008901_16540 [Bifidobacterium pullorum]